MCVIKWYEEAIFAMTTRMCNSYCGDQHSVCFCWRLAKDEFDIVANSWRYGATFVDFEVYFAFVDYDEASDVFNYVCYYDYYCDLWEAYN